MACSKNCYRVGAKAVACQTYEKVYLSLLVPYSETYQSFSEDSKIELSTSQKRSNKSPKGTIFEENDMDQDLETPDKNVKQLPKWSCLTQVKLHFLNLEMLLNTSLLITQIQDGENWMSSVGQAKQQARTSIWWMSLWNKVNLLDWTYGHGVLK